MVKVLYEDNHLLVCDKPAGLLTQPTDKIKTSLETEAKAWLKKKYEKKGNVFLEAIHRLDRVVSGVVVFAKTSKALSRLKKEVREKQTKKQYHALVSPPPQKHEATLEHRLIHGDHCAEVSPKGKASILHYKILESKKGKALLEVDLETGRYHQIRVQLATIGSPIVGDVKYGSRETWHGAGIALHHSTFSIRHPITQELLQFHSDKNF